ncbi:MAG TPA: PD-(D/E)XK nuclease family protein [Chloroflexota bacterium]|nr:PD-(D/E)XK nuclease family protein [Chloroflexota bacterium]
MRHIELFGGNPQEDPIPVLTPREVRLPGPPLNAYGRGAAWGRAAHRVLAAAAQGLDYTLWERLAGDALAEEGATPGDALALVAEISAVWESELGARIRRATRVLVEVPFAIAGEASALGLAPDEGPAEALLEGVIDLACLEGDGRWTLLDYKTDAGAAAHLDALVAHYGPQVRQYALTWRQFQREPLREALLVFTAPLRLVAVE